MAFPGIGIREVNKGSITMEKFIPGEALQTFEVSDVATC